MAVRRNILTNAAARDAFTRGAVLLKRDMPGTTTHDVGLAGPSVPLSTYDLFVLWHYATMNTFTPPTQHDRNAAHRGPVFLPWHRWMLLLLEEHFRRVLSDPNFALPYWDWAADGDKPRSQQLASALWAPNALGGTGSPVTTGPFAFNPADPNSFRVRIAENLITGRLEVTNRGLNRQLGQDPQTVSLPTTTQVAAALRQTRFDRSPWSTASTGFRNRAEGWSPGPGAGLHNRVHVWVGGDMGPGTSPNDPVFFLNHCNVDRIWEAWMTSHGRVYQPPQTAPPALAGHRVNDTLRSALTTTTTTITAMLDVTSLYSYDALHTA